MEQDVFTGEGEPLTRLLERLSVPEQVASDVVGLVMLANGAQQISSGYVPDWYVTVTDRRRVEMYAQVNGVEITLTRSW